VLEADTARKSKATAARDGSSQESVRSEEVSGVTSIAFKDDVSVLSERAMWTRGLCLWVSKCQQTQA
jgi:hypothetical protein